MGKIEIDQVDDRVIAGIQSEAIVHGRSFEEQVRVILSPYAIRSKEERTKRFDAIRAMTLKGVQQPDSTELIRALRDANYDLG